MTDDYDTIEEDRNVSRAERDWSSPIAIAPGSNMRSLVRALLSEADRIDGDLERIYNEQHIDSATGRSLEAWGRLVSVDRLTGESDDKYRARIKSEFRQATTGTTFNDFSEYSAAVLGTDIENLRFNINYSNDPALVTVSADQEIYDANDLTNQEVKDILADGVPAGHTVEVLTYGTFIVKADGDGDDPDKGLTSDAIETGGTLAEDLI